MAVVVQYIVEKDGIQKMTFDNKKEAEAYDKVLDITADMWVLLEKANVAIEDNQMEELCMFLAKNKDEAMLILKGAKSKVAANTKSKKEKAAPVSNKQSTKKSAVNKAEESKETAENKAESSANISKAKTKAA